MHTALRLAMLCGLAPPALAAFTGFAPRVDLPLAAGYSPTASALADLDHDGDLDIAVTVFTADTYDRVAIILNNGDGTFASPVYRGVGSSPVAIVAKDVNLDGDIDLLTANRDSDDFSLLLGNGDGTFQSEYWRPVGDRPQDIAVADLNADALPDVAVVNEFDDSVSVYFNDGDGTFTLHATYTTNNPDGIWGNGPRGLIAVDLNFDTLPDLVTANTGSNRATIMYNINGAAGNFYNSEFALFLDTDASPIAVNAHDHDGDGDIDLVFACSSSSRIHRRFNELSGNPGAIYAYFPTSSSFYIGGSRPVGLCTADFDDLEGDSDRDIVVADELSDQIDILLNNGTGGILFGGRFDAAGSPQNPCAGDLDGDGDDDIITPQYNDDSVGIFFNTATVIGGPAPVVRIDEPGNYGTAGGCVCGPSMTVTGVADIPAGGIFESYTVQYRRSDQPDAWTTIVESTGTVAEPGGTLGVWNFPAAPEGFYLLRLTATSASGLSASDEAIVWVSQNYNTVDFHFAAGYDDASSPVVGRTACIYGTVNDDACGSNTYTVEYRPIGAGTWGPVDPAVPVYSGDRLNTELATWNTVALGVPDGLFEVRVIGRNACGQSRSLTRTVTVDNTLPTAAITGPTNCMYVDPSGIFAIKGTASDANLTTWVLEFTGGPYNTWRTIEVGTSNVVNGLLAEWDVNDLPPCAYTLRLRAHDASALNCGTSTGRTDHLVTVHVGCRADLAAPYEVLDLADISTFIESFLAGCP